MTTTAERYFSAYVKNATNGTSNGAVVQHIPQDVPLETLVALQAYKPNVELMQRVNANFPIVQSKIRQQLLADDKVVYANLSAFIPRVFEGNAIQSKQSRNKQFGDVSSNKNMRNTTSRDKVLAGISPKLRKLVSLLKDLNLLKILQDTISAFTKKLEDMINKVSAMINTLLNAPGAIVDAALTAAIAFLEQMQDQYEKYKQIAKNVAEALKNTKVAIVKAFNDIPGILGNIKNNLKILGRILLLKEPPRGIKYPKWPKLPTINFTGANLFAKYRDAVEALKKKSALANEQAFTKLLVQSGFEIDDPDKDVVQRNLAKARNALRVQREKIRVIQGVRNDAINNVKNGLIKQVRNINTTVAKKQAEALAAYQRANERVKSTKEIAKEKIQQRVERVESNITAGTNLRNEITGIDKKLKDTANSLSSGTNVSTFKSNVAISIENLKTRTSIPPSTTSETQVLVADAPVIPEILQSKVDVKGQTIISRASSLDKQLSVDKAIFLNNEAAQRAGLLRRTPAGGTRKIEEINLKGIQYYIATVTMTHES